MFGCAALGAAAGNLWVTITDLVDADGLRVVGDLLLLGSLGLVVLALAIYPAGPRRPIDLVRIVLDGVVLAGSILLISEQHADPDGSPNSPPRSRSPWCWRR